MRYVMYGNIKYFLAVLLTGTVTLLWADEGVDITDPSRIAALVAIQENLDTVSAAVMECMDAGKPHHDCMCEHKELVTRFNDSVTRAFSKHPELEQYDLVRFKSPDGIWISQSLGNLEKQAGAVLLCE